MDKRSSTEAGGVASTRYATLWDGKDASPDLAEFLDAYPNATPREVTDVLLIDQVARWQKRVGRPVEEYLDAFPSLTEDPELLLDLVYGEYRTRSILGQAIDLNVMFDRFPDLRAALTRQIEVGQWLQYADQDVRDNKMVFPGDEENTIDGAEASESTDAFAALSFGDFKLQNAIGAGAMGEVYKAFQKSLRRWVAIKVLKEFGLGHPKGVERFLREARAIASLRHPNIVTIYGIGRMPNGGYFLAMELVEGVSLKEAMRDGPMDLSEAARIVAQVADGIGHANTRGIIHRDLKPSNVLIEMDGHIVVTDFGLAKQYGFDDQSLSSSGDIVGTPQYMAPEQVDSRWGEVGPATDVYGLGALFYDLLVGRPPTQGNSIIEVLTAIGAGKLPVAPGTLRQGIPSEIETICLKCLAASPKDRYCSAEEVAKAVRREVDKLKPDTTVIYLSPRGGRSLRWIKGNRRVHIWGIVAIIVGSIILVAAIGWWGKIMGNGGGIRENAAIETGLPNASENWREVGVTWTIDAYQQGRMDNRVRLTETGGLVRNGDRLRVRVDLTEPLYVYLVWIGSEGCVESLYPNDSTPDKMTRSITVPSSNNSGLPVRGPSGVEICLLVIRHTPLSDSDKRCLMNELHSPRSIWSLSPSTLLADGKSVMSGEVGSQGKGRTIADSGSEPEDLGFASGSRSVGHAEPLYDLPDRQAVSEWAQQVTSGYGEFRYLVLPHVER